MHVTQDCSKASQLLVDYCSMLGLLTDVQAPAIVDFSFLLFFFYALCKLPLQTALCICSNCAAMCCL